MIQELNLMKPYLLYHINSWFKSRVFLYDRTMQEQSEDQILNTIQWGIT